jgi:AcrR family transcriptional regulator
MNQQNRCRLRADARRESIIDAAIHLFSEKGFKGATTRELSAAVGVSEPVIYEHFRTKQDLYDAMMDRMADKAIEDFEALIDVHSALQDDTAFFTGLAHSIVEWFLRDPEFVRLFLFSALDGDELSRRFHERVRNRIVGSLKHYFEARPEQPHRDLDPEIVSHLFLCIMAHHGLLQVLLDHHPSRGHDEVIEGMVEIFMRGISK